MEGKKEKENNHTQQKEIKIKLEKEELDINNDVQTKIEKETMMVEEKDKDGEKHIEKIELSSLVKLEEKIEGKEDIENNKKEIIEDIGQKIEELKEKEKNENSQKEKIEQIEEKIERLKEEEIKNIKLIPKQELIITVIHNITPNVTEAHLKEIFSNYGEVKEVYIPINKETQLKKNYAFIEFVKKECAEKAQLYMDEGQIDGKVIRVEILSQKNCVKMK